MSFDAADPSEILIEKTHCPGCGSTDNLARYADGHAYCFGFGCDYRERADGKADTTARKAPKKTSVDLLEIDTYEAIPGRKLNAETCQKLKYGKGTYKGQPCHVVNVPDQDGNIVAQKIRLPGKDFRFIGDTKTAGLVFQDKWPKGGRRVIVTEGEIDALSVSQVQDNKYPVVSLPNGVDNALKVCTRSIDYLQSFEEVVLMFDMDEQGKQCALQISKLIGPKAKLAELPEKDANECLKANNSKAVVNAIFNAQPYRPEGIITLASLREEMTKAVEMGRPWIYDILTRETYGRRPGELYFFGAGSGIGKTDFFLQQMVADILAGHGVAMFLLEQPVGETGRRLCGKKAGKRFHIPDVQYTEEEILEVFDELAEYPCFLFNHFGSKAWEDIRDNIRWLAVSENVQDFYIDHLTALASHEDDERKALQRITAEMSGLAQELGINLYVVSHLSTPEGKPHEEGGRVMAKHFKGSRSIIYWAHFMFGMERNTQAQDAVLQSTTLFRCLKDRFTGRATGLTFYLGYDTDTGLLFEQPEGWKPPSEDEDEAGSSFGNGDF